jgi:TPR repeat protein
MHSFYYLLLLLFTILITSCYATDPYDENNNNNIEDDLDLLDDLDEEEQNVLIQDILDEIIEDDDELIIEQDENEIEKIILEEDIEKELQDNHNDEDEEDENDEDSNIDDNEDEDFAMTELTDDEDDEEIDDTDNKDDNENITDDDDDDDNEEQESTQQQPITTIIGLLNTFDRYRLFDLYREAIQVALVDFPINECLEVCPPPDQLSFPSCPLLDSSYPNFISFQQLPEGILRQFIVDFITYFNLVDKLFLPGGVIKRRIKWTYGNAKLDPSDFLAEALEKVSEDYAQGVKMLCELWYRNGMKDLQTVIEMFELYVFDSNFRNVLMMEPNHQHCLKDFLGEILPTLFNSQVEEIKTKLQGQPDYLIAYILSLSAVLELTGIYPSGDGLGTTTKTSSSSSSTTTTSNDRMSIPLQKASASASMDDPLGHFILAKYFGMNRTTITTSATIDDNNHEEKIEQLDCERSMGHLGAIASLTISFIQDQVHGGTMLPDRLSSLAEDGLVEYIAFRNGAEFDIEIAHWQYQIEEFNDPNDMVALGEILLFGAPDIGVHPRPRQAGRLFFTAATEFGNGAAASHLAQLIHDGEIDNPDGPDVNVNETAYKYYQLAAEKGEASGYTGMAYFHQYGGISSGINLTEALRLYDYAANKYNYSDAHFRAGHVLLSMSTSRPNMSEILHRWHRAAEDGHVLAALETGFLYHGDFNDEQSCIKAMKYFLQVGRGDWSRMLNFDPLRAFTAFLDGREIDAVKMYLVSSYGLWSTEAQMNSAWLLEFGVPKQDIDEFVGNAARAALSSWAMVEMNQGSKNCYLPVAGKINGDDDDFTLVLLSEKGTTINEECNDNNNNHMVTITTQTNNGNDDESNIKNDNSLLLFWYHLFYFLRSLGRAIFTWFGQGFVRESSMENPTRKSTSLLVKQMYLDVSLQGNGIAEAWRRLGDCHAITLHNNTNRVCTYDPYLAIKFYQRASKLGDGQATWTLAMLRTVSFGGLQSNITQSKIDLEHVSNELDWAGSLAAWIGIVWINLYDFFGLKLQQ